MLARSIRSAVGPAALALLACSGSPTIDSTHSAVADETCPADCAILPRLPGKPTITADTVPPNGDVNPYGIAFVPAEFPLRERLRAGDVLVSNFNNNQNLQGTGTTLVKIKPHGHPVVFYEDAGAPGFSTALGVLSAGYVILGNLPSTDGSGSCSGDEDNVGEGSLMIIDGNGKLVKRITDATLLDGPWDLAVRDGTRRAQVFVSNAKSGAVTRVDLDFSSGAPSVVSKTQIASGYAHRCDPAAFVVAPTGLALDRDADVLYVASTGDNAIFSIPNARARTSDAGMGALVAQDATHFHGPLGLVRASNGDLISSQGDAVNPDANQPSEIVEVTGAGAFVSQFSIDSAPGSAFGLALEQQGTSFRFAAVDDGLNVLDIWDVGQMTLLASR